MESQTVEGQSAPAPESDSARDATLGSIGLSTGRRIDTSNADVTEFARTFLWGVGEHETDDFTTMTGWRFGKSWYFGHQDGEDSGISLLWQRDSTQMSISQEGIRYTRRF